MKTKILIKRVFCFALVIFVALFCCSTALAVDIDGDGIDDDATQYIEPETEPVYTEPAATQLVDTTMPALTEQQTYAPTEPETEPQAQVSEPSEPETEATQQTESDAYAAQYVDTDPAPSIDIEVPTLAKTISTKKYSTNYTAGLVSWACVIIGTIVIAVVLISTKASGRMGNGRQRYDDGNRMNSNKRLLNDEYYGGRR